MEFASSLSSCSKSKPQFKYHVFINCWGENVYRDFVSHLHSALSDAKVNTFLDYENLFMGMQLEELMRAIEGSQLAIVVFTKTYAESNTCLDELAKIIECHETYGQRVVPVFYEIDPSDVLNQIGDFRKALEAAALKRFSRKHRGSKVDQSILGITGKSINTLSRWSEAVTKAANLPGWDERKHR
ncbi:TMV resistance protein N [Spatholobus suberectus]|nr:TMV resistance protein N [Spatholobus suberectus]